MSATPFSVNTIAGLLAATPGILGYAPHNSIVAYLLADDVQPRRMNLQVTLCAPLALAAEHLPEYALRCRHAAPESGAAVLAAVTESHLEVLGVELLRLLREALRLVGIEVVRIVYTASVSEPGHWTDPDTGVTGNTLSYSTSEVTTAAVLAGRSITGARADIDREFTPGPAVSALIPMVVSEDIIASTVAELDHHMTEPEELSPGLLADAAALVVSNPRLRDALLRLGVGRELAAGQTWTRIAAAHRGSVRAQLLTVAAFSYYTAGDGVRAGIALDHVSQACDSTGAALPRLATQLRTALDHGFPPEKLRSIVPTRAQAPLPGTEL